MLSVPSSSSSSSVRLAAAMKKKTAAAPTAAKTKWRSGAQQRIFGRRLLDALRDRAPPLAPRAVKAAADSALALTARGQSRWSRAILLGGGASCRRRVLVKAGGKIRRYRRPSRSSKISPAAAAAAGGEPAALKGRKVRERLQVLARLVPGCRKLPTPMLLEEAADYVAALELQVKTMRSLADALAAAQLSSPPLQEAEAEMDMER